MVLWRVMDGGCRLACWPPGVICTTKMQEDHHPSHDRGRATQWTSSSTRAQRRCERASCELEQHVQAVASATLMRATSLACS